MGFTSRTMGALSSAALVATIGAFFVLTACQSSPSGSGSKATVAKGPIPAPKQTVVDPRTGKLITPGSADSADLPFIPSGAAGPSGIQDEKALWKKIIAKVKDPRDLPRYYSSSIFNNPLINNLEFPPDAVVADIGAGTGAFVVQSLLAGRKFAKLYAVDTSPESLEFLQRIVERFFPAEKDKIETVGAKPDNMNLPPRSIDFALINDAHYFVPALAGSEENLRIAIESLKSLHAAMKPSGKVVVFQNSPWGEQSQPIPAPKVGDPAPTPGPGALAFRETQVNIIGEQFTAAGFKVEKKSVDNSCPCYAFVLRP